MWNASFGIITERQMREGWRANGKASLCKTWVLQKWKRAAVLHLGAACAGGGGDRPRSLPGLRAGCSGTLGMSFVKVPACLASPLPAFLGGWSHPPHSRRREGVAHLWEMCFGVTRVQRRPFAPSGAVRTAMLRKGSGGRLSPGLCSLFK